MVNAGGQRAESRLNRKVNVLPIFTLSLLSIWSVPCRVKGVMFCSIVHCVCIVQGAVNIVTVRRAVTDPDCFKGLLCDELYTILPCKLLGRSGIGSKVTADHDLPPPVSANGAASLARPHLTEHDLEF